MKVEEDCIPCSRLHETLKNLNLDEKTIIEVHMISQNVGGHTEYVFDFYCYV